MGTTPGQGGNPHCPLRTLAFRRRTGGHQNPRPVRRQVGNRIFFRAHYAAYLRAFRPAPTHLETQQHEAMFLVDRLRWAMSEAE